MKTFIGREAELQILEREYRRDSGFVVLYGRRRVGKTTLIKEFLRDKQAMYFLATEELEIGNRKRFAETLAGSTGQDYLKSVTFSDWEALFKVYAAWEPGQKKVLVIDEFQYLVSSNPAFSSIFQRIWDEILKDQQVMIILCGSLISMMTTHVLSYSSPLYGRRTAQIRLSPLRFTEVLYHSKGRTFEQLVETYSVTGGVPKYMDFFGGEEPLMESIASEVLQKGSFLYDEPTFLLEKEVKELVSYFSIIKTVASGQHKLSKIAGVLGLQSNAISPYIKTLMDLDLIEKRLPVTENQPEKSRKSLYFIKDHFIAFWFRYVHAYKGELEMDNIPYVMDKIDRGFVESHVSYIYEEICKDILSDLCKKGKISFKPSKIGSYWNNHIEIDVVALDEEGKQALIGECKYHVKSVDADVLFDLMKKAESVVELNGYGKSYVLFSKSGFTDRLQDIAKQNNRVFLVNENQVL